MVRGPLKYEKQVLKDKEIISKITVLQGQPLWLAFLKRSRMRLAINRALLWLKDQRNRSGVQFVKQF
jgi:hypothetical protein